MTVKIKTNHLLPIILIISFFVIVILNWNYISGSRNKTLNLALLSSITTLDPAKAFDGESLKPISQVYEPLYQYHYLLRPFKIIPLLADGMPEISEKGTKYTIKIKKNIHYHDHPALNNTPRFVKAQDFINQIKRVAYKSTQSTGRWLFEGKIVGFDEFSKEVGQDFDKFLKTNISGLSAPDDHTLVIKLKKKIHQMKYFLTMNFLVPIPIEVIKHHKNNLDNITIGTGPFYLAPLQTNQKIILNKFDKYRTDYYPNIGDRYANQNQLVSSKKEIIPFLSRIVFHIVKNEKERWDHFVNKKLDILEIPKSHIKRFLTSFENIPPELKNEGVELKYFSSLINRWLGFNMKDPILGKNIYLRKAMAHAIDVESYIREITQNTNLEANSIFTPGIPGYDPKQRLPYKYSLDIAKKYLIKAGYPGGLGLPTITYSTRSERQISLNEAQFIKEQLKKIGIKIKIQTLSFSNFLKKGRRGELQFWTDNWIYDYPDAENLLQLLISNNHPGINKSAYSNSKVDELYRKLNSSITVDDKFKIIKQIENIVNNDLPWIMLTYERAYVLHHSYVKNFRKSSFIRNYLKFIKIQ